MVRLIPHGLLNSLDASRYGQVATIYNYKTGETPTEEYDWHIGGNNKIVVNRIRELVKE